MNICRICLVSGPQEDIFETYVDNISKDRKKYVDLIKFCLDIEVTDQSTTTTKLCIECVKKLITFHKFKSLALKSDEYLKALHEDVIVKLEDIDHDQECIKSEEGCLSDEECVMSEEGCLSDNGFIIKEETNNDADIKSEESVNGTALDCESDDELLSVINKSQDEEVEVLTKTKEKRGRGRKTKCVTEQKTCSAIIKQMCEECGKIVKDLKTHSLLHQPEFVRKRFSCKECPKMFSSYSARTKHYKYKHLGLKPICKLCNKAVSQMSHHMKTTHNRHELQHVCLLCEHRFVSASSLATHMTKHTKERALQCDQCKKMFTTKHLLQMHVRGVHEKERSHLCQLCSKSFFKKCKLQEHLRTHTKEKPYKCPDCGKHYQTSTILKNHRLTHGNVKKHACSLCDMTFMTIRYLNAHMISHTKEKRYPCHYCSMKYHRSDHRKRHEYTAHQKHLLTSDCTK